MTVLNAITAWMFFCSQCKAHVMPMAYTEPWPHPQWETFKLTGMSKI